MSPCGPTAFTWAGSSDCRHPVDADHRCSDYVAHLASARLACQTRLGICLPQPRGSFWNADVLGPTPLRLVTAARARELPGTEADTELWAPQLVATGSRCLCRLLPARPAAWLGTSARSRRR